MAASWSFLRKGGKKRVSETSAVQFHSGVVYKQIIYVYKQVFNYVTALDGLEEMEAASGGCRNAKVEAAGVLSLFCPWKQT